MYPILFFYDQYFFVHKIVILMVYLLSITFGFFLWKKMYGRNLKHFFVFFGICFLSTIIGIRGMFVIENWDFFQNSLVDILKLNQGGFDSWGGWIFGLICVTLYAKKVNLNTLKVLDGVVIPCAMLGQSIMCLGCFGAGCIIGKVTSLPWGVIHTHPLTAIPPMFRGVPLHPVPLYSFSMNIILFFLSFAINKRKKYDGQTTFIVLGLYAISYFFIHGFQSNYLANFIFGTLSVQKLISIFVFLFSVIGFLCVTKKWVSKTNTEQY